jgi:hypothetical protein
MDEIWSWINSNYPNKKSTYNKCNIAVRQLVSKFPKLAIRTGICLGRYHCWAVTSDDCIVDPTVSQFDIVPSQKDYIVIADRFLSPDELEPSTGALFMSQALAGVVTDDVVTDDNLDQRHYAQHREATGHELIG